MTVIIDRFISEITSSGHSIYLPFHPVSPCLRFLEVSQLQDLRPPKHLVSSGSLNRHVSWRRRTGTIVWRLWQISISVFLSPSLARRGQVLFLGIHAQNACRARPRTAVPAGHFFLKMETLSLGSSRHLLVLRRARYLGLALWFWVLRASCQEL